MLESKIFRFLDLNEFFAFYEIGLIDACFLVLMMIAFNFDVDLVVAQLPVHIRVVIDVDFGYYSFVGATLISMAVTHVMIFYHRK